MHLQTRNQACRDQSIVMVHLKRADHRFLSRRINAIVINVYDQNVA